MNKIDIIFKLDMIKLNLVPFIITSVMVLSTITWALIMAHKSIKKAGDKS